jgi:hypothetical protein
VLLFVAFERSLLAYIDPGVGVGRDRMFLVIFFGVMLVWILKPWRTIARRVHKRQNSPSTTELPRPTERAEL